MRQDGMYRVRKILESWKGEGGKVSSKLQGLLDQRCQRYSLWAGSSPQKPSTLALGLGVNPQATFSMHAMPTQATPGYTSAHVRSSASPQAVSTVLEWPEWAAWFWSGQHHDMCNTQSSCSRTHTGSSVEWMCTVSCGTVSDWLEHALHAAQSWTGCSGTCRVCGSPSRTHAGFSIQGQSVGLIQPVD